MIKIFSKEKEKTAEILKTNWNTNWIYFKVKNQYNKG
jgi:hypothetical protein